MPAVPAARPGSCRILQGVLHAQSAPSSECTVRLEPSVGRVSAALCRVLPRPVVMQLASKEIKLNLDNDDDDEGDADDADDAWMRQAGRGHRVLTSACRGAWPGWNKQRPGTPSALQAQQAEEGDAAKAVGKFKFSSSQRRKLVGVGDVAGLALKLQCWVSWVLDCCSLSCHSLPAVFCSADLCPTVCRQTIQWSHMCSCKRSRVNGESLHKAANKMHQTRSCSLCTCMQDPLHRLGRHHFDHVWYEGV